MADPTNAAPPAPAQPAADTSVSTTNPNNGSDVLSSLSREDYATWQKDGTLPTSVKPAAKKDEPAAAPAAAAGDDEAPAVDARGQQIRDASGKFVSKRQQKINETIARGVETGIASERAARERVERELQELRARHQPAQPAAQPAQSAQPAEDKEPQLDDFLAEPDPYLAYGRAIAKWELRQELKARDARDAEARGASEAERAVLHAFNGYQERENTFKTDKPDFDAKTLAVRQQLNPMLSPLAAAVLDSPVGPALILHLAEHPEDFERIGRLGLDPRTLPVALREIGRLEAKYDSPAAPASVAASPAPPAKHVSSAPPPPPALGTRPAEPADAKAAALARNDFTSYAAEADKADLAAMRR